jgi:DNA-binding MarR family transcriptional regulator
MDELLEQDGLSRVGWQVLNVLHAEGGLLEGDLYRMLEANASSQVLVETVNTLLVHGWILRTKHEPAMKSPRLQLSAAGQAAHERIRQRVSDFRQQSMQGISKEAYQTAIDVLQQIVHNVDASRNIETDR